MVSLSQLQQNGACGIMQDWGGGLPDNTPMKYYTRGMVYLANLSNLIATLDTCKLVNAEGMKSSRCSSSNTSNPKDHESTQISPKVILGVSNKKLCGLLQANKTLVVKPLVGHVMKLNPNESHCARAWGPPRNKTTTWKTVSLKGGGVKTAHNLCHGGALSWLSKIPSGLMTIPTKPKYRSLQVFHHGYILYLLKWYAQMCTLNGEVKFRGKAGSF